jgi:hypothetical protein
MDRAEFFEDNDVVAWLILGYLCSYPDAKDTAEGVANWWLGGEGIDVEAAVIRGSLDYLVRLGWLRATRLSAGITVYGLNQSRRGHLQCFMESHIGLH